MKRQNSSSSDCGAALSAWRRREKQNKWNKQKKKQPRLSGGGEESGTRPINPACGSSADWTLSAALTGFCCPSFMFWCQPVVMDDSDPCQAAKTRTKVSAIQISSVISSLAVLLDCFNLWSSKATSTFSAGSSVSKHYYWSYVKAYLIDGSCMSNVDIWVMDSVNIFENTPPAKKKEAADSSRLQHSYTYFPSTS